MRKGFIIGFIGLFGLITACEKANLDALAFPREELDSYAFDNNSEEYGAVPWQYAVAEEDRTLVTMNSVDETTGETYTIYGVYIGDISTISSDTIIVYCHGQAKHMDAYWTRASILASVTEKHNYGVLMMDYRGFGMSEGVPTEQGLYEDVDASIEWLRDHGAIGERTFYYGFSLGCIPVIDRAAYKPDFKPAKIILESPLASVENLAHTSLILNIDPQFVSTLVFNNAEKIKDVDVPLQWFHGVEDDYIEIENGELVFANHSGSYKEAQRVEGAGHGDVPEIYGVPDYLDAIEAFMKK